jgi:hypothetical protein
MFPPYRKNKSEEWNDEHKFLDFIPLVLKQIQQLIVVTNTGLLEFQQLNVNYLQDKLFNFYKL